MPAPVRSGRRCPARRRAPAVTPVPFAVTAVSWPRGVDPMYGYESALRRAGFPAIAGVDEAGRGACAGPLVVAACVLAPGDRIGGLDDSKVLSPSTRERLFDVIVRRASAYRVVELPAADIDAYGLHVANLTGMRRAVGALAPTVDYALTDGFAVPGMAVPATAVCKGDATVACIAAASILAKVTRDRIMVELHARYPAYGFDRHKGYVTTDHEAALTRHGPCAQHRRRYVNVRRASAGTPISPAADRSLMTASARATTGTEGKRP